MSVRAKMQLSTITERAWSGGQIAKTLRFECAYDPEMPEDQRFQKATPSGFAEFQIDNPAALAQFSLGQFYYVEFSPVTVPAKS